jgi:DNA-binding HxlR family transcriptional regulator
MRWSEIGDSRCSIARALSVVGDRWTLLLLREAFLGTVRFEDFHDNTGAARHIVGSRLAHLVDNGVLERVQYSDRPARFEYTLTAKGNDLYPVIVSLLAWGDRWMIEGLDPSLTLIHDGCGHAVTPELRCPRCERPVEASNVHHVIDP